LIGHACWWGGLDVHACWYGLDGDEISADLSESRRNLADLGDARPLLGGCFLRSALCLPPLHPLSSSAPPAASSAPLCPTSLSPLAFSSTLLSPGPLLPWTTHAQSFDAAEMRPLATIPWERTASNLHRISCRAPLLRPLLRFPWDHGTMGPWDHPASCAAHRPSAHPFQPWAWLSALATSPLRPLSPSRPRLLHYALLRCPSPPPCSSALVPCYLDHHLLARRPCQLPPRLQPWVHATSSITTSLLFGLASFLHAFSPGSMLPRSPPPCSSALPASSTPSALGPCYLLHHHLLALRPCQLPLSFLHTLGPVVSPISSSTPLPLLRTAEWRARGLAEKEALGSEEMRALSPLQGPILCGTSSGRAGGGNRDNKKATAALSTACACDQCRQRKKAHCEQQQVIFNRNA